MEPVVRAGGMEEDEPGDKFRMLRGGQAGQSGTDARSDNHRPFAAAGGAAKFMEATCIIFGPERTVRTLALAEANPVGRQHAVAGSKKRIDFGPLVRGGTRKKIVQKDQRFPLPAHVINNLSARGALHAARKDGR